MAKFKITMPKPDPGFRYYRLDNTPVDLVNGQEIEGDDIPTRDRDARIAAGHMTPVAAPKAAVEDATKPKK